MADSIDSDINNLMAVLKVWQIFPEGLCLFSLRWTIILRVLSAGLYVDSAIAVARQELAAECNYNKEAAHSEKFRYTGPSLLITLPLLEGLGALSMVF